MIANHVKLALRNLRRHPGYAAINVVGLAVGIASCILIGLYVEHELSYDAYHENADRVYRISVSVGDSEQVRDQATSPMPLAPGLEEYFPDVAAAVRLRSFSRSTPAWRGEDGYYEPRFFFADPSVFDLLTVPFLRGSAEDALARPHTIVLTRSTARKYFGDEDPVGETIHVDAFRNGGAAYEITGVVADPPNNTHLHFDMLASFSSQQGTTMTSWSWLPSVYTYVLLRGDASISSIAAQFDAFVEDRVANALDEGDRFVLSAEALPDIHLKSQRAFEIAPTSSPALLSVMAVIGLGILLLACVNFINLTTARSADRAREVGIRKTLGAARAEVASQFFGEAALMAGAAVLLGLGIASAALPHFNGLVSRTLVLSFTPGRGVLLGALFVVVSAASGLYPALVMAGYQPAAVLKGSGSPKGASVGLRKGLVVLQFAVSTVLVICTLTAYSQLEYLRGKSLGFDKEQLVSFFLEDETRANVDALKQAYLQLPGISGATASLLIPGEDSWTWGVRAGGSDDGPVIGTYMVDFDFLSVYDIGLVAGRPFDAERSTDSTDAFVLNESAVEVLSLGSPEDAIGSTLHWSDERSGRVIGVVEDFHVASLHSPIEPVVMFVEPWYRFLTLRIATADVQRLLPQMEAIWRSFAPHLPFQYTFLDDRFEVLHESDRRMTRTITVFAAIAVVIACLGLLGLASYSAQARTKEIGVRKVLGASSVAIAGLFSKDFLALIVLSFVVAAPVAHVAMRSWLDTFAYRIELGPGLFLASGAAVALIALLTVSYHAVRAALADPVDSLRYE